MPIGARRVLLDLIDEAFDHRAWHGTTLYGSLRGVTAAAAAARPARGRHNIWEVTAAPWTANFRSVHFSGQRFRWIPRRALHSSTISSVCQPICAPLSAAPAMRTCRRRTERAA